MNMKLMMLVDGSRTNIEKMADAARERHKSAICIEVKSTDDIHEYRQLLKETKHFNQTDEEIMLVKFSGRESVVNALGDESPDMIIPISYNKNSNYYNENPIDTFVDLINVFERGD
jgi:hypothetical protein